MDDASTIFQQIEERVSDVPHVSRIWRNHSNHVRRFTSIAVSNWEIVFTKQRGSVSVSVRGPETFASPAEIPEDAEFLGIVFRHGAFLQKRPPLQLVDEPLTLPALSGDSFWFEGDTLEIPTFENADAFVAKLIRDDLLAFDPVIEDTLRGGVSNLSPRSMQRRFLRATGLTQGAIQQISRAKQAVTALREGLAILDVADLAGYADQPHLTRSLRRYFGHTPAQILSASKRPN